MAFRNGSPKIVSRFQGLNATDNLENIAADFWSDSMNMIVNSKGSAETMRSPKQFSATAGSSPAAPVISMAAYVNPNEERLLLDVNMSSGDHVSTFKIENDFSLTSLRANQHDVPFVSLVINFQLYRLSKYEMIQHTSPSTGWASWDVFAVGVTPPASAPTISYVGSGGTGQILDNISLSYGYMNSRTGEVSIPSGVSNILGASAVNDQIAVPVVASTQHGVDKIVFFPTIDGGSEPFLLIDSSGDPVTKANATTTYDIDVGSLLYDTLTPQPLFNAVPPVGAQFMFIWKDVVFLCFFDGTNVPANTAAYSALAACPMGIPQSCFPPLNLLSAASKGETMYGGISTQFGALLMSDFDSYLLEGVPDDIVSGPLAPTAVNQILDPLNWKIGTKSPKTIQSTPFGTVWLDQAMRIRIWNGMGLPSEAGLPLRGALAELDVTKLFDCEAQWFQFSDDGGVYMLVGTLANGNQQAFIMSMYQDPASGAQMTGFAISSIKSYCLAPMWDASVLMLFSGGVDKVDVLRLSDLISQQSTYESASTWPGGTEIFFEIIYGNENNFQYWHSLHFDADIDLTKLTVTVRDLVKSADGESEPEAIANARTLTPEWSDEAPTTAYTLIDEYGRRKVIRFAFDPTDEQRDFDGESASDSDSTALPPTRKVKNIRVLFSNKKRLI